MTEADSSTPTTTASWRRWLPAALAVAVALAYLPSLGGGFLNYDDPWLIVDNKLLGGPAPAALRAIWTDLGYAARMQLGAEYLPLRDSSHLLEILLAGGPHPQLMRVVQLLLYIAAVLLFRVALLRTLGQRSMAEVAAWLFALHPVHAESVAWLAGRKEVLALLFIGGALAVHAGSSRHRPVTVPLLLAAACLSKSMSVAALALLPAVDLVKWRRPDWRVYVVSAVLCGQLAALAAHVGGIVHIAVPFWGGSRSHAAATMGPLWLRYLGLSVWPSGLSLVHDVRVRDTWDALAAVGVATVLTWGIVGGILALRRRPLVGASWLWFVAPLLPVSHMLVSIENRMADRYLFLSVMGPALLAAAAVATLGRRGLAVGAAAVLALGTVTAVRAHLFSDSRLIFADATEKTAVNAIAPYQLGMALEEAGRDGEAIAAFRETIERAHPPRAAGRKASTALAMLLARQGNLDEAEEVLRRAARDWAADPIVLADLAEVVARQGRTEEARALFLDVMQRWTSYTWARDRYRERFGEPPPAPIAR